ncbi:MAG: hypothetical protein ACJA01_001325 [Saprospiraceae bacterium]|jgi:hypothetical protein
MIFGQRNTEEEANDQLDYAVGFFLEIDLLRSLQSMSGVHNSGKGASGFNVRGGNADQNLILQDGHLIFNLLMLWDFSFYFIQI